MRILPAGDRALLVELDVLADVLALFQEMGESLPNGVTEVVPAARTLLVRYDAAAVSAHQVTDWLRDLSRQVAEAGTDAVLSLAPSHRVEIPVHYTGEDLDEVAGMLGLSPAQVIERHTGHDYLAAFAGFAPGFVYLTGGDPCFNGMPRRAVPRTRVPAGSVAIGGDFSAVYPSDSPGGWRLLGVTPLHMWDLERDAPALVRPGFGVRFRDLAAPNVHYSLPPQPGDAVGSLVKECVAAPGGVTSGREVAPGQTWFEVLTPGPQTLLQDLGRPGMTALGVSGSGALDPASMETANRLVGNPFDAAVLENVWGGLAIVCHGCAVVAVTGAPAPVVLTTASGMRVPAAAGSRLIMEEGQTLRLGRPRAGMRCYVAVQGGWDVPPVLGSRATDMLSGIGPDALRKGSRLKVARAAGGCGADRSDVSAPKTSDVTVDGSGPSGRSIGQTPWFPVPGDMVGLDVVLGPRDDWFDAAALDRLLYQEWVVTPQSNRVGLRLEGDQPLTRARSGELPSEGMVAGAIEVPSSGQPVLFLADHPLTGGYPVIAVVVDRDLGKLAQVSPGVRLTFRVVETELDRLPPE